MNKTLLFKVLRFSGLPFLFRELVQRRRVTILLFHDISRETAAQTFDYLSRTYHLLDLQTFIRACTQGTPVRLPPKSLILTFDDGHRRNHDLLGLLKEKKIPVTIFVCAGIIGTNRHFWFRHNATNHRSSELRRLPNRERLCRLRGAGFAQEAEYEIPHALSQRQMDEMKPWVDFQSHTLFHPCLPRCSSSEAHDEIFGSRDILRRYGLRVNAISFPHGDYSDRDIELCRQAGYECGITVDCGFNTTRTNLFRLKRLPVNDTEDLNELIVKASGSWEFVKRALGGNCRYGWTDEVQEEPPDRLSGTADVTKAQPRVVPLHARRHIWRGLAVAAALLMMVLLRSSYTDTPAAAAQTALVGIHRVNLDSLEQLMAEDNWGKPCECPRSKSGGGVAMPCCTRGLCLCGCQAREFQGRQVECCVVQKPNAPAISVTLVPEAPTALGMTLSNRTTAAGEPIWQANCGPCNMASVRFGTESLCVVGEVPLEELVALLNALEE